MIGAGAPQKGAGRWWVMLVVVKGEKTLMIVIFAVANLGGENNCGILIPTTNGMLT